MSGGFVTQAPAPRSSWPAVLVVGFIATVLASGAGFWGGRQVRAHSDHPAATPIAASVAPSVALPTLPPAEPQPFVGPPTVRLVGRTPTSIPLGSGKNLLKHLAPSLGVETFPIGGSTGGVFSVAQLGADHGNAATLTPQFRSYGVRTAVAGSWLSADGTRVYIELVQCSNAVGAAAYFNWRKTRNFADSGVANYYPIAGAGPAYGFDRLEFDVYGSRQVELIYQDGSIDIDLRVYVSGTPDWTYAIARLQEQINALAAR